LLFFLDLFASNKQVLQKRQKRLKFIGCHPEACGKKRAEVLQDKQENKKRLQKRYSKRQKSGV